MNFNSVGEVDDRVKQAFALETLARLQALKASTALRMCSASPIR
jgi:hypothetical protein